MFQTITLRIIELLSVFRFIVTGRVAPRLNHNDWAVCLLWTRAALIHPISDFLDELRVAERRRGSPFTGIPSPQHERVVVDVTNQLFWSQPAILFLVE